jgi:hypothetical protein
MSQSHQSQEFRVNPLTSQVPQSPRVYGEKVPGMAYVRDLVPGDLPRLGEEELGVVTPMLSRLKHRHHSLARAIASGMRPGEAAAATGYTSSRVSILQNDPAFAQLVAFYKSQADAKFANSMEKRAELHDTALDELQSRLDEGPEKFKNEELVDLIKVVGPTPGQTGRANQTPQFGIQISFTEPPERGLIDVTPTDSKP